MEFLIYLLISITMSLSIVAGSFLNSIAKEEISEIKKELNYAKILINICLTLIILKLVIMNKSYLSLAVFLILLLAFVYIEFVLKKHLWVLESILLSFMAFLSLQYELSYFVLPLTFIAFVLTYTINNSKSSESRNYRKIFFNVASIVISMIFFYFVYSLI